MITKEQQLHNNKPKVKKQNLSKLKKKAWTLFSQYIRLRDCLSTSHSFERGTCCTCGEMIPYNSSQAGHFVPGRHNSVLFDKRNVHLQCYRCNVLLKGNPRKYDKFMKLHYGQEVIDELDLLDGQLKQFTLYELEELIVQIKQDVLNLGH